jgi:hypothetical protein
MALVPASQLAVNMSSEHLSGHRFSEKRRNNMVAARNLHLTFSFLAVTNEPLKTVHVKFCLEIDSNHTFSLNIF